MSYRPVLQTLNQIDYVGMMKVQYNQIFHVELVQFCFQTFDPLNFIAARHVLVESVAERLELLISAVNHFFVDGIIDVVGIVLDIFLVVFPFSLEWNLECLEKFHYIMTSLFIVSN